jgi:hypothetical protein
VSHIAFSLALVVALVAIVSASRVLYLAWSDHRFRRERRLGEDRRQRDMVVPMERRKRRRRA